VVAGVVVGLVVSFILVVAVEMIGAVVHPTPEGFGGTTEEMCRHVEGIPPWFLAVAAALWAATAFVGTWIARKIGNVYAAAAVGLLLVAGVVFNVAMLPYPLWFKVGTLLAILIAVTVGSRWTTLRKAGAGNAP
jgi:hypothetical protein